MNTINWWDCLQLALLSRIVANQEYGIMFKILGYMWAVLGAVLLIVSFFGG